jgi:hypothetical protein
MTTFAALLELLAGAFRRRPRYDLTDPRVRMMAFAEFMRQERAAGVSRHMSANGDRIFVSGDVQIHMYPSDKEKDQ